MTLDAISYRVLGAIASLRGTSDDVYDGYFLPITVSQYLGLSVKAVRDEYDLLAHAGFLKLTRGLGADRIGTLAVLTSEGDAELATRRKLVNTANVPALPALMSDRYDIFLSHASEDNDYAIPLYDLLSAQFTVFIDKIGLRAGADFSFDIGKVIAASSFGVFLITPAFMEKGYTREELGAFLHRAIEHKRPHTIIPVTRNVTFAQVSSFNELLARRLQLDADLLSLAEVVQEIALVVRPPTVPLAPSTSDPGKPYSGEGPEDALPEQRHLLPFLPRVEFANSEVQRDGARYDLSFSLRSVGPGDCFDLAYFLPCLDEGQSPHRLSKDRPFSRTVRLDQTPAFREHVKSYYKAVFEFQDVAGNIYRQYGDIHQTGDADPNYWVENMSRPYLVAQRIIRL